MFLVAHLTHTHTRFYCMGLLFLNLNGIETVLISPGDVIRSNGRLMLAARWLAAAIVNQNQELAATEQRVLRAYTVHSNRNHSKRNETISFSWICLC